MVELNFTAIRSRIQYRRGGITPIRELGCIICRIEPRHHFKLMVGLIVRERRSI